MSESRTQRYGVKDAPSQTSDLGSTLVYQQHSFGDIEPGKVIQAHPMRTQPTSKKRSTDCSMGVEQRSQAQLKNFSRSKAC